MLQFDLNGKASLYPHKVKYNRDGKSHEQWALPDKEWWVQTANKWKDIKNMEFVEVSLTPEQLKRFESIKDSIVEGFGFEGYILNGEFQRGIIGMPKEIQEKVQEYNQRIFNEKDEAKKDALIEERRNIIPRPTLQEVLEFVKTNVKK